MTADLRPGYLGSVARLPRGESLDRIVAVVLLVAGELEVVAGSAGSGSQAALAAGTAVMSGAVAFRRRWPLAMGSVAMLANGLVWLAGAKPNSLAYPIAWFCGLYAVAVWTSNREFVVGLVVLAFSNVLAFFGNGHDFKSAAQFTIFPAIIMFVVRRAVRDRQLRADALATKAELLEREKELRAKEAVAEERARIARELHDLVAHNVSVMVVQAGTERHALPDSQAPTREVLGAIEESGRQALSEARRLLGMLRREGEHEELEPQPSLDRVDFLVEQIERAGLPVSLHVEGERRSLPAGLDLCAYRIVQEGLTNALRHAGPAHAEVTLRYGATALEVEVLDDGAGAAQKNGHGAGHGLIGMRERVALYGGELATGPRPGGGFAVRARLPLG
jgi:signal transduction histidine kinase